MSAPFSLFRVLIPSWRFFDRAFAAPTLWIQEGADSNEWKNLYPSLSSRNAGNLFLNPYDAKNFSFHALLDQWQVEIEEGLPEGVSFELVRNFITSEIALTKETYRLRLCTLSPAFGRSNKAPPENFGPHLKVLHETKEISR